MCKSPFEVDIVKGEIIFKEEDQAPKHLKGAVVHFTQEDLEKIYGTGVKGLYSGIMRIKQIKNKWFLDGLDQEKLEQVNIEDVNVIDNWREVLESVG